MDIINFSGALALSTRLQKLAEQLRKEGTLFYKSYGTEEALKKQSFLQRAMALKVKDRV